MQKKWRKLAKLARRKRIMVWVLWRDACSVGGGGWMTYDEVRDELKAPDYRIKSVGFLRGVSAKYLTIVQGFSLRNASCSHLEHIPRSAVIQLWRIGGKGKRLL
jgi:hypothetical protein